jgi:hypothetical protein
VPIENALRAVLRETQGKRTATVASYRLADDPGLLAEPEWRSVLTAEDRRGLTPLLRSHMLPYGEVKLDMGSRLHLAADASGEWMIDAEVLLTAGRREGALLSLAVLST